MPDVLQTYAVVMTDNGRSLAVLRPAPTGRIATRRGIHAGRVRACQDIVQIHGIAASAHDLPFFSQCGLFSDVIGGRMKIVDVPGDEHAFGIVPGTFADTVPRVYARVSAGRRRAQVRTLVGMR